MNIEITQLLILWYDSHRLNTIGCPRGARSDETYFGTCLTNSGGKRTFRGYWNRLYNGDSCNSATFIAYWRQAARLSAKHKHSVLVFCVWSKKRGHWWSTARRERRRMQCCCFVCLSMWSVRFSIERLRIDASASFVVRMRGRSWTLGHSVNVELSQRRHQPLFVVKNLGMRSRNYIFGGVSFIFRCSKWVFWTPGTFCDWT